MRKNILALLAAGFVAFSVAGSAAAADASDTLNIEVAVENSCDIGVQDYSGVVSGASNESGNVNAGIVNVSCNYGTAYLVTMDPSGLNFGLGAGAGADTRRSLADGEGEFLSYNIFQDASMTIPWADGAFGLAGVGTGAFEQYFYHLTFYNPNLVTDGVYTDAVPVTVTYN